MAPLIVLLIGFIISLLLLKWKTKSFNYALAGRIAMAIMLLFTAIGHFMYTEGMSMMIPAFIPNKTGIVYATGILEILFAIGLLLPSTSVVTGWLLVLFFIFILPGNIYAAQHQVNYQQADYNGPGLSYLWFRIPLQVLFILWTYFSAIKYNTANASSSSFRRATSKQ
jgi:uncharacterized membrane protein